MPAPFHPRSEWAVRHPSFGDLHLPVTEVYAHHTAGKYMPVFDVGDMRNLEEAEIGRGQYVALAYHELYMGDGAVVESRPLSKMGGATLNKNATSVAVCLPGNYVGGIVSWGQAASAIDRLVAMVLYGVLTPTFALRPHSAVYPTECPAAFKDHLAGIRQSVADALAHAPEPPHVDPPHVDPGDAQAFLAHLAEAVTETRRYLAIGAVVGPGVHNDAAWTVQVACNVAGHTPALTLDGVFGERTAAAVLAYQAARNLTEPRWPGRGFVGALTYRSMFPE